MQKKLLRQLYSRSRKSVYESHALRCKSLPCELRQRLGTHTALVSDCIGKKLGFLGKGSLLVLELHNLVEIESRRI